MNDTNRKPLEESAVTVDVLIFTVEHDQLKVLLVKRGNEPFKGKWAVPGGFIQKGESLDDAALRVSREKTGVKDLYFEQLYTFGSPKRDPRSRIVTVAYFALIPSQKLQKIKSRSVQETAWYPIKSAPTLAFDHKEILTYAISRLKTKASYSSIGSALLPRMFRLSELQNIYEIILDQPLDKRNFRKRMMSFNILKATGKKDLDGAHRPAMLYTFTTRDVVFFE